MIPTKKAASVCRYYWHRYYSSGVLEGKTLRYIVSDGCATCAATSPFDGRLISGKPTLYDDV